MATIERVKLFSDTEQEPLQKEINEWFAENQGIEVVHRAMAFSNPDNILGICAIAIFYIEKPAAKRPARVASSPRAKNSLERVK